MWIAISYDATCYVVNWEAWTLRQRRRTRVWCGVKWRRARDAAARASGHVLPRVFFFFFFSRLSPTVRRLGPIRAESGRLRLYRAKPANSSPYSSFPTCRRLLEWTQAMAEAAAASPFFILSACPFQFYFKFSLPCFMFSFCFVNLARDWVLEMIKRFDKSFISMGPHVILIYE